MLKKENIVEIVELTEDFVAKVLCPKLEEYGGADGKRELVGNIVATMGTVAKCAQAGATEYRKVNGKWTCKDDDEPDTPEEKEEPKPKKGKECPEGLADEMTDLIREIQKVAKKYADGDRREYCTTIASTALTLIELGGKGAREAAMVGMMGIITGKV